MLTDRILNHVNKQLELAAINPALAHSHQIDHLEEKPVIVLEGPLAITLGYLEEIWPKQRQPGLSAYQYLSGQQCRADIERMIETLDFGPNEWLTLLVKSAADSDPGASAWEATKVTPGKDWVELANQAQPNEEVARRQRNALAELVSLSEIHLHQVVMNITSEIKIALNSAADTILGSFAAGRLCLTVSIAPNESMWSVTNMTETEERAFMILATSGHAMTGNLTAFIFERSTGNIMSRSCAPFVILNKLEPVETAPDYQKTVSSVLENAAYECHDALMVAELEAIRKQVYQTDSVQAA